MTDAQWRALREALAAEVRAWTKAVGERRQWDKDSLTEAMASAIHLAYHLGAIRQIQPGAAGPPAAPEPRSASKVRR